jgi:serine/threonine-protein kinase
MTQPSTEFLALQGALAGEYSLQRELGRGGMGVVYLARDVQLDRDVAIKILPAHLARSAAARERFLREARMAAGLSHPHIVPIHRVSEAGGFVFFVMSYVEGETLGERLRARGPLPPAEAMRVLREVAWALAYAHGRGIVHRDVKPDNILLEAATGRALVTDFGIAHGGEPGSDTDPGKIMGTAHFMSPEQAAGDPLDGRSDLYALGVLGYLAVSGRLPFESANLPALIVRQASEEPPSVMRVAPGLPSALGAAIDRCLARDPDDRFADGEALAAALATAVARPALPPALRAWLGARNPLLVPYLGWSAGFSVLTLANLIAWVTGNRPDGPADIVVLAAVASLPLLPIVGFHLNQAYRQFRAGHTLTDLRAALEIARREREESEALVRDKVEPRAHRPLRLATVGSATWLAVTFGLVASGVVHENQLGIVFVLVPLATTMLLGAVSNALDVQFIPTKIRNWWQTGVRDRLWNSRAGAWLARRLGAPEQSRAVGGGVFRATEAALGLAAAELYEALPKAHREHLGELPAIITALEARAAEARAEMEVLDAMASQRSDADVLAARRQSAAAHLAESVAALESIRLDLLRLHAGAGDLAPLTTLMDAARRIGEDVNRLAEAQREVEDAAGRGSGSERISTPT